MDTGASISAFFLKHIDRNVQEIDFSKNIKIKGIAGATTTIGSADVPLEVNGINVTHKFLMMDAFDEYIHGILGSDFFEQYGAIIDHEIFEISLRIDNNRISIPMESKCNEYVHIPPRCEVIRHFRVLQTKDCIIVPEEIGKSVFVAGMLIRPTEQTILIRFLNVRDEAIKIKNFYPKLVDADYYEIVTFSDIQHSSVNRVEEVLKQIQRDTLHKDERNALEHIVAKFADVFNCQMTH